MPRHALSARAVEEMCRYIALVGTLISVQGFKGTGSRLGACALIKLLFSDLLVILSLIIALTCLSAVTYYSEPK